MPHIGECFVLVWAFKEMLKKAWAISSQISLISHSVPLSTSEKLSKIYSGAKKYLVRQWICKFSYLE